MHTHQGMPGSAQGGTEHGANFTGADNADSEACGFQMIRGHTLNYMRYSKIGVFFSVHQGASKIMADRYRELCRRRCVIGPGAVSTGGDLGGNAFGIVNL